MLPREIAWHDNETSPAMQQIQRKIELLRKRIEELEQFDPQSVLRPRAPEVAALEIAIEETLTKVFGKNTPQYELYSIARVLDRSPLNRQRSRLSQIHKYLQEGKSSSLLLLEKAILSLEEDADDLRQNADVKGALASATAKNNSKVFIVHGHDQAAHLDVQLFLTKIGLVPIILSQQPSQGRTIIEKFEQYANEVAFAVVLLTPDDIAHSHREDRQQFRARQNVIFELGYFAGKLGRGRTVLLIKNEIEIPSDLYGIVYIEMLPGDGWKNELAKEMKHAGIDFEINGLIG